MAYLLFIYLIFILVFSVYSAIGIYHLWRFGYIGDLTKPVIFAYIGAVVLILIITTILIFTRPWPFEFTY